MPMLTRLLGIVFGAALIANFGCTPKSITTDTTAIDIFSNRPVQAEADLYVITLQKPPLLKVAKKTPGGWQISEQDKQELLSEQSSFEQSLMARAPQAQVIYRFRMILNGLAVFATPDQAESFRGLSGVKGVSRALPLARPITQQNGQRLKISEMTSVRFIGAEEAHKSGITGQGKVVGIIDTGIDFTHAMLGGSGNKEEFAGMDPSQAHPSYPNAKVVGGIDLVGSAFDAGSPYSSLHRPWPDANPVDEGGHGTHVAGTVAGIGDGVNTYSGVAPGATLHAIKVFGKDGSTSDAVVVAALEYSADPNGDLNPDDQLDVVNLSLGGGFGSPKVLYTEAVRNLSEAGTMVVAAAGNSGAVDYVVGAPSTADDALSVAASIDASPHNWQFPAVLFQTHQGEQYVKAVEGPVSLPISEAGDVRGPLVDIGLADQDLSDEVKNQLKGKIALMKRGVVTFQAKIQRAFQAGAIGAVVYNNTPGEPAAMGGDTQIPIPAIMISQAVGENLAAAIKVGTVSLVFKTDQKINQPDLVDTITDFSSKGPRSEDNLFKPEIAAPGQQIISAAMGEGSAGVPLNGTSMATPHMAGVVALVKQAKPHLSSNEIKALLMSTTTLLSKGGNRIPLTLQGAGRVQIQNALAAKIIPQPGAISLGLVQVGSSKTIHRQLTVKNLTDSPTQLRLKAEDSEAIVTEVPALIELGPQESQLIEVVFKVVNDQKLTPRSEIETLITIEQNGQLLAQVPVLGMRAVATDIRATGTADNGLILSNTSPVPGFAMAFNLLDEDPRKPHGKPGQTWKSQSCDLQSAGYRLLRKPGPNGDVEVVQFGIKLHNPLSHWLSCEVSVLIDADEDGVADQEIAGVSGSGIEGLDQFPFATVLLDSVRARSLRLEYEQKLSSGPKEEQAIPSVDYKTATLAISPMAPFDNSTIAVIEAPLPAIAKTKDGALNIKLAALSTDSDNIEVDDYLGITQSAWRKLPSTIEQQPFYGMSEIATVGKTGRLTVNRGSGTGKLVLYYPRNSIVEGQETQSQIVE